MAEHVSATIGATPLIKLERLSEELGATVYVKFEASNPGGSIKDRAAMNMIDAAEARGEIASGRSVLVEPTSGNTGIGIAMIGAARGYDVVLTMPESMSKERRMLLAAYGAKLVLTPAAEGMAGAVAEAERIERDTPGAWIVGQFTNPDNPAAHEKTTGPEIKKALGGVNPDYVVAAAGTGGTVSGVAHFFNGHGKFRPGGLVDLVGERVRIYAVEPDESPLISQALAGEERTMIFYESPYRVVRCLEQFAEVFGEDRRVSVSREITKKFEQTVRGTVAEVLGHFRTTEPKGEFVIVVAGKPKVRRVREDGEE